MKKLALSASMLGALALAACGGGDDGGIIVPDGGGGDGGNVGICNPQTQAGCNPGEKCTAIFPPAGTMGPIVTGCVPDGTVEEGGACNRPQADMGGVDTGRDDGTRTDDCVGGTFCDNQDGMDICTPLCSAGVAGSCQDNAAGARACVGVSGLFDDLPMGNETGVCVAQCAPVSDGAMGLPNDSCPATDGCFGLLRTAEFVCLSIPEESVDLKAFQMCAPTNSAGQCFLNSAPQGAIVFQSEYSSTGGDSVVTPWCKPISTHTNSPTPAQDADGDEAVLACGPTNLESGGGGQCRYVQSILFSNLDLSGIPDDVGICVNSANEGWLNSPDFDVDAFAAAAVSQPTDDDLPFCQGCITIAELDAALMAAMNAAVGPTLTLKELRAKLELPPAPAGFLEAVNAYVKSRNGAAPRVPTAVDPKKPLNY